MEVWVLEKRITEGVWDIEGIFSSLEKAQKGAKQLKPQAVEISLWEIDCELIESQIDPQLKEKAQ